jgi:hypothetical protein
MEAAMDTLNALAVAELSERTIHRPDSWHSRLVAFFVAAVRRKRLRPVSLSNHLRRDIGLAPLPTPRDWHV